MNNFLNNLTLTSVLFRNPLLPTSPQLSLHAAISITDPTIVDPSDTRSTTQTHDNMHIETLTLSLKTTQQPNVPTNVVEKLSTTTHKEPTPASSSSIIRVKSTYQWELSLNFKKLMTMIYFHVICLLHLDLPAPSHNLGNQMSW